MNNQIRSLLRHRWYQCIRNWLNLVKVIKTKSTLKRQMMLIKYSKMESLKILTRQIWLIILNYNKIPKFQPFRLSILKRKEINKKVWMWTQALKRILNHLNFLNWKKLIKAILLMKSQLLFAACTISSSCLWSFAWINFLGILQFWVCTTFQKEAQSYSVEIIKTNLLMEVFSFLLPTEMLDFLWLQK